MDCAFYKHVQSISLQIAISRRVNVIACYSSTHARADTYTHTHTHRHLHTHLPTHLPTYTHTQYIIANYFCVCFINSITNTNSKCMIEDHNGELACENGAGWVQTNGDGGQ